MKAASQGCGHLTQHLPEKGLSTTLLGNHFAQMCLYFQAFQVVLWGDSSMAYRLQYRDSVNFLECKYITIIKESILVLIFESEVALMPVTSNGSEEGRKYSQILTLDESG